MEQRVLKNNKGLSLVEVLIAMVVFLLVSLAMMQTALVGIDSNMINNLRDEAVKIAEQRMNEARNLPFNQTIDLLHGDSSDPNLNSTICPADFITKFGTTGLLMQKSIRNVSNFNFCTNRDVVLLNAENKQVSITIGWKWKENNYNHSITTIVRQR